MNRRIQTVLLLGWILWFTQEESRPTLVQPTHWSMLGRFDLESECNAFGQRLVGQLGNVSPQKGYSRGKASMSLIDTRRESQQNEIQDQEQTTLYCISEDVDPRPPTKK